ncbi:RsfA family transcriptional regulator [Neobacillus piezotolerans]|uniref:RsfA family transcriptional regulator n=1 Tax=Neobacillus piezotolerans TaxID=2259171 RepID=A0A3D8GVH5_9BACI|nr:RsfA family transcriptional regulator [Neobacillus piezotolerans]RDU38470.1 RsfA family transcriptional regulator [Neobacillus piezotolerans]
MPSTRQDAWTPDEDLLLAEVILRNIREGGTQLQAFEEVGRQLSRTPAACGFRWNSHVRKQYKAGIEHAKSQRKEGKKLGDPQGKKVSRNVGEIEREERKEEGGKPIDFHSIISYLGQLYELAENSASNANGQKQLLARIEELEVENGRLLAELDRIKEDYHSLMEILERARTMAFSKDGSQQMQQKAKFQVDKFGNLERIE